MALSLGKIRNVLELSSNERYLYFVRKIADFEEVWGLRGDSGWLTVHGANPDQVGFPVWPELEFAELCATDEWHGMTASKIALVDFLEKWLPGLSTDKRVVSVFPTSGSKSLLIDPLVLLEDIRRECDQYE